MKGQLLSILVGAALGVGGMLVFAPDGDANPVRTDRDAADPALAARVARQADKITALQIELSQANARLGEEKRAREALQELNEKLAGELQGAEHEEMKAREAGAPLTDEEFKKGIEKFGSQLQGIIFGNDDGKAARELRALLKRAGPKGIERLRKRYDDPAAGYMGRLVAAHALAQSGDPQALVLLQETLRDPDSDMMELRVTSHALAFSEGDEAVPLLTSVARGEAEPGTRANSAFGLARRGIDEGFELYARATDDALEQGAPEAIAFIQGFALMDDEKSLPLLRKRLATYENETALITLIEVVKSKRDKGAAEQLRKLAYDGSKPKSVQNAAKGALTALGTE